MSRPSRAGGIAWVCISVAFLYPTSRTVFCSSGIKGSVEKRGPDRSPCTSSFRSSGLGLEDREPDASLDVADILVEEKL